MDCQGYLHQIILNLSTSNSYRIRFSIGGRVCEV